MRTGTLGRAFDSTAASYKFFWLLAMLRVLPRHEILHVRTVVAEMMVIAWAPAVLFRLSFGLHDRLHDAVREFHTQSGLRATSTESQVRTALARWPETEARIDALSQLVPSRFLGPWLELGLSPAIRDDRRTRAIIRVARETLIDADGPPYALVRGDEGFELEFGPHWRDWLLQHQLILEGHTEFALARFLQARNPHVPGVPNKVRMPGGRKMAPARRIFERMRAGRSGLADGYSDAMLGSSYAIDHVLPRSFVAHDLLWNLLPTSVETNRRKAEALPAEALLPKIARYHFAIAAASPHQGAEIEDYIAVFGLSEAELRGLSQDAFGERYLRIFKPLWQVAMSQGFRADWSPTSLLAD
jgi:hypothetical protein